MQPKTTLVGADGAVELNAVAVIDLDLAVVIHPGHPEKNRPLRGGQPLQQRFPAVAGLVPVNDGGEGFQHLGNGLNKFRLVGILTLDPFQYLTAITHRQMSSCRVFFGLLYQKKRENAIPFFQPGKKNKQN